MTSQETGTVIELLQLFLYLDFSVTDFLYMSNETSSTCVKCSLYFLRFDHYFHGVHDTEKIDESVIIDFFFIS